MGKSRIKCAKNYTGLNEHIQHAYGTPGHVSSCADAVDTRYGITFF